jgi:hypothetical protein
MVLEVCRSHRGGGVEAAAVVVMSPVQLGPGRIPLIFHMMNLVYRGVREGLVQLSCRHFGCYRVSIDGQLLIHKGKLLRSQLTIDLACGSAGS